LVVRGEKLESKSPTKKEKRQPRQGDHIPDLWKERGHEESKLLKDGKWKKR